jgi:hypothetical protein
MALRDHDSHELIEASLVYRTRGTVPHNPLRRGFETSERVPVCFLQKRNFLETLRNWENFPVASQISPDEVLRLISEEYECADGFIEYRQGLSPGEHLENLQKIQARVRDDEIRNLVWQREDARDQRAEDWHREEMEALRTQHKQQLIMFGIVVGVLSIIGSVAGGVLDGLVSRGVDVWPF